MSSPLTLWQKSLNKTRQAFNKIGLLGTQWSETDFEACENALLQADVGVHSTQKILAALRAYPHKQQTLQTALCEVLSHALQPLAAPQKILSLTTEKPKVIMLAGINGSGKTTTIAKITHYFLQLDKKVLLAAADTFRAAAREQLKYWGECQAVRVIEQQGANPATVAFDTLQSAKASDTDIVLIDTAGRLPTQQNLMAELTRIHRVCGKAMEGAPHESWLVLDGTQGQNTVAQVQGFLSAIPLSGILITKLDGSAKGGFIVTLAEKFKIPIIFIGIGEHLEDLQPFDPSFYASAIVG